VAHLLAHRESAEVLPTACDRGRVNGCEKSHRASGNGANVGGWAKLNDAVSGNGSENESEASASAGDAKNGGRRHEARWM